MSLVGQAYEEPGSWGRLSRGWPTIVLASKEEYDEAWHYCVRGPNGKGAVQYGSYVGMMDTKYHGYGKDPTYSCFEIRLETKEYLDKVTKHMTEWRKKHAT